MAYEVDCLLNLLGGWMFNFQESEDCGSIVGNGNITDVIDHHFVQTDRSEWTLQDVGNWSCCHDCKKETQYLILLKNLISGTHLFWIYRTQMQCTKHIEILTSNSTRIFITIHWENLRILIDSIEFSEILSILLRITTSITYFDSITQSVRIDVCTACNRWLMFEGKSLIQFADICSVVCNYLNKFLPFCVRTGAPEVRDPAIDKVLATVDIFSIWKNR